jgi:hypothetical protein
VLPLLPVLTVVGLTVIVPDPSALCTSVRAPHDVTKANTAAAASVKRIVPG